MSERYLFEFGGAPFTVTVHPPTDGEPITSEPPNVRVIEGTWGTWHLSVPDPSVPGIEGVRLVRSVGSDGGEHPRGNLSEAESATRGHMLMVTSDGYLYGVPTGYGIVSRFFTEAGWQSILDEWEARVRPTSAS